MKPIVNSTFLGLLLSVAISSSALADGGKSSNPATTDRKSAETITGREKDQVVSFVVFTFAATEACKESHPALSAELDDALKSWRSRNKKHVELALADPRFNALKRDALATRPSTPLAEALCRDTIRSLGVSAETDIDVLRPRDSRASGNPEQSIGYPSVSAALEGLKRDPAAKFRHEAGWTIVSQKEEKNSILWSFPPRTHPAYPAAVKRTLLEKDGAFHIQMSALCQAEKVACDKLVEEFGVLNDKMREQMERNAKQSAGPGVRNEGTRR